MIKFSINFTFIKSFPWRFPGKMYVSTCSSPSYYAGIRGIPLAVVQSIVGHMSPEMTKHYSAHATLEEKRKNIGLMSDFMEGSDMLSATDSERAELHKLADTLPLEQIRNLLKMLQAG